MHIRDLAYFYDDQGNKQVKSPWRADLQPASFRGAFFHCEANAVESGRRIVIHEFPKKNLPYAEDMGRKTYEITVRGYCVQYMHSERPQGIGSGSQLYRTDYRIARDALSNELISGEPGPLKLPTMKGASYNELIVICPRFRLTEEDRAGGYCVFDMTFVEQGVAPSKPQPDNRDEVIKYFKEMRDRNVDILTRGTTQSATAGSDV